jgi:hypothetical protein
MSLTDDPFPKTHDDSWMQVTVVAPADVGGAVLDLLRGQGFREIDWCELERDDNARADYGPAAPLFRRSA